MLCVNKSLPSSSFTDRPNFPQAAWKRRISVLRRARSLDKATEELIQYLDTFYTDPEGWLELADIYVSNRQYVAPLQLLRVNLTLSVQVHVGPASIISCTSPQPAEPVHICAIRRDRIFFR